MKNDFAILRFSKIRNCGVDPLVEMGCPSWLAASPAALAFSVRRGNSSTINV